jgi:hypothetical protein
MIYAGDSWALKGFTEQNYDLGNRVPVKDDVRMADHWHMPYITCVAPGKGNLSVLDRILTKQISAQVPIIWIYTEPGRDFGRITKKPEHDWIKSKDIFAIRKELDYKILKQIKKTLPNPIGLIGGLSDVDVTVATQLGFTVLHPSWQQWMSNRLGRQDYFKFGWGASDVGWRQNSDNIRPSAEALFAWDELIKEWCLWEDLGYMCHEHPTTLSNKEFADFLKQHVITWIQNVKK